MGRGLTPVFVAGFALLACFSSPARGQAPQFQVDASWPKPLPNRWILGQVSGIATGQRVQKFRRTDRQE